ncbi:PrsW family intramembrane metalloprotease [Amycolatopsis sp. NPDC098790]|uniref:PrsW family intramembrane metalloprotease n=1 Tax=Amycolatopsis sp. NPDC098790 TaxID=3363939 RepID=UPI0037FA7FC8
MGTRAANQILAVAAALSVAYGHGLLLDLVKPDLRSPIPWMTFVAPPPTEMFTLVRACVLVSWGVAAVVSLVGLVRQRQGAGRGAGVWQLTVAGVLLAPFVITPVVVLARNLGATAICVPSTAFALWALTKMQHYRRMTCWVPLAGLAWGCLIAAGFASAMSAWFYQYGAAYLLDLGVALQEPGATVGRLMTLRALNTGFFEELGKAAGIAMLYFGFRRHIDDVVSGIVVGAAVGLGFNFSETVLYMSVFDGAAYQYFGRQSVGLFASHVAFTALVGAGIGAARQLRERWQKIVVVFAGLLAAAGTHFANNALQPHTTDLRHHLFGNNVWLRDLLGVPMTIVLLQGPLVVLYLLLSWRGNRTQASAIAVELATEARTGHGAVTEQEVPILLSPARRFFLRYRTFRRQGRGAARHLRKLHAAQLELATLRWHRTRDEVAPGSPDEQTLRERVLDFKSGPARTASEPDKLLTEVTA